MKRGLFFFLTDLAKRTVVRNPQLPLPMPGPVDAEARGVVLDRWEAEPANQGGGDGWGMNVNRDGEEGGELMTPVPAREANETENENDNENSEDELSVSLESWEEGEIDMSD